MHLRVNSLRVRTYTGYDPLVMGKSRKKKKRRKSNKKSSSGGGGLMISLRGGFKKAAHRATGAGPKKKPSKIGTIISYAFTLALLAVAAYLLLRRLEYI